MVEVVKVNPTKKNTATIKKKNKLICLQEATPTWQHLQAQTASAAFLPTGGAG